MEEGKIALYKKPSFVFLLLIPVLLIVFRYIIGFNGLYGQDSYEYAGFSMITFDYFHKWMIPHSFHWPILYPLLGAVLQFIFSSDLSLQLISISAFAGTLYFIHRIIVLLNPSGKGKLAYVLVFGLLSSYLLRLGVCVMSDMLAIFFITAALFNIIQYERTKKLATIFRIIMFSSLGFLTREPVAIILFVPILRFIYLLFRDLPAGQAGKRTDVLLRTILIAIPFLGLVYYCRQFQVDHISQLFSEWSISNFFRNEYGSPGSGFQHYRFWNIISILQFFVHPGYLLLSAVFLFFVRRTDLTEGKFYFFILPILFYLLFLAGFMHQNVRLNTMALPLWMIFLFPAFLRFSEKFLKTENLRKSALLIVLSSQLILFYFAFNKFIARCKLEKEIAAAMNEKYPGMPVYTLGMEGAIGTYSRGREFHTLGNSEPECGVEKLILIETINFEKQWKNLRPFGDWYFYQQNCNVHKVMSFEQGWDLYECK